MVSVFKNIGKGALYVIALPLGIIAIAGYAIFGVFVFFFQFVRLIYLFFTGRNLRSDLPEDVKAREIIEANKPKEEEKDESLSLYPSDSIVYSGGYQSPTFEDEKKEEEVEHEPKHLDEEKEESEDDEYFDHLV